MNQPRQFDEMVQEAWMATLTGLPQRFRSPTMTPMDEKLVGIEAKLDELLGLLRQPAQPAPARTHYAIEEVAEMVGVTTGTVRLWCRHGRIEASKRRERRGGAELWSVSAEEVARYKDQGLRELDPRWNEGRRAGLAETRATVRGR